MKINYNTSAVHANDYLSQSEEALSSSTERLSSGYKINRAKDNPSGIAIAKRMNAQIKGLSTASDSASDGISVIQVAEGALTEVHDMLQRMNELSIKSANGTMSENDRKIVQEEIDELRDEITRISETTEFNGSTLLNGTYDLKGYVEKYTDAGNNVSAFDTSCVTVESYSDEAKTGFYEIEFTASISQTSGEFIISDVEILNNRATATMHGREVNIRSVENLVVPEQDENGRITVTADDGFSLTLQFDMEKLQAGGQNTVNEKFVVDLTGYGAMTMQIGSNEGQTLDIRIPTVSARSLGIADLDVTTADAAKESIDKITAAIDQVSSVRSRLGAYQNRLEHTISSLDITEENMEAAYSRIMDVDMAEEMTEYTQQQVLSQAGTSILAQANDRPSQILQLLQ